MISTTCKESGLSTTCKLTHVRLHDSILHMRDTTEKPWILDSRPDVEILENNPTEYARVPNDIAEATYRYSLSAQRVMHHIAAHIPQLVESIKGEQTLTSKMLRVSTSVIKDLCGIKKEEIIGTGQWAKRLSENDQVARIANELANRPIKTLVVVDGKTALYSGGFLAYVLVYPSEQYVEFYVNPPLLPLYLTMSRYVKMGLTLVGDIQSQYTMRVYVLLKQYEGFAKNNRLGRWERRLEIGWLREHLGIEPTEYKNGAHFRKYVIEQSVLEINKLADIATEVEYIRGKRNSIIAAVFSCHHKKSESKNSQALTFWDQTDIERYHQEIENILENAKSDPKYMDWNPEILRECAKLEAKEKIESLSKRKQPLNL